MPLSNSEKEAMSDRDIEKWEKTGKENILSKDENLRKIIDLLKGFTSKTYTIDGEKVSLIRIYDKLNKDDSGLLFEDSGEKICTVNKNNVNRKCISIAKKIKKELMKNKLNKIKDMF